MSSSHTQESTLRANTASLFETGVLVGCSALSVAFEPWESWSPIWKVEFKTASRDCVSLVMAFGWKQVSHIVFDACHILFCMCVRLCLDVWLTIQKQLSGCYGHISGIGL